MWDATSSYPWKSVKSLDQNSVVLELVGGGWRGLEGVGGGLHKYKLSLSIADTLGNHLSSLFGGLTYMYIVSILFSWYMYPRL